MASPPTMTVHAPPKAVATTITYRCRNIDSIDPTIDSTTTATAGGSPPLPRLLQATCATSAPSPAPTSAIPMKYANISSSAPQTPPTSDATIMPVVLVTPIAELASIAPSTNP